MVKGEKILITGAAGFIGYHLSLKLCEEGFRVLGMDNLNDYYDVRLKEARLNKLKPFSNFSFRLIDISVKEKVEDCFQEFQPDIVVNLAAQAGVRYSIDNPKAYMDSNIMGFYNILEACRRSYEDGSHPVAHLVFASSSSIYGNRKNAPFSIGDYTDKPVSLYAATKKSNELMAYTYSYLYGIPATGLRFFTVYGPMGRPDMAYFKFSESIMMHESIKVYNYGDLYRDFTYIDDIIEGIYRILSNPPGEDEDGVNYKLYNIGNSKPVKLSYFIQVLEETLDRKAKLEYLPMQPGDVYQTYADVTELERDFDFRPRTSLREGLERFAVWFKEWKELNQSK